MTARKSKRARALPLLFTGPNVVRIMAGLKTQTRRTKGLEFPAAVGGPDRGRLLSVTVEHGRTVATFGDSIPDDPVPLRIVCPYGAPGEELWVRETWGYRGGQYGGSDKLGRLPDSVKLASIAYRADGKRIDYRRPKDDEGGIPKQHMPERLRRPADSDDASYELQAEYHEWLRRWWASWRPSIFLPRWAARTFLLVKAIRVERLHAISEADCMAEGIGIDPKVRGERCYTAPGLAERFSSPRVAFRALWESVNGKGSWDVDPWLWCIDFRRAK